MTVNHESVSTGKRPAPTAGEPIRRSRKAMLMKTPKPPAQHEIQALVQTLTLAGMQTEADIVLGLAADRASTFVLIGKWAIRWQMLRASILGDKHKDSETINWAVRHVDSQMPGSIAEDIPTGPDRRRTQP